jgi:hypothetical protein
MGVKTVSTEKRTQTRIVKQRQTDIKQMEKDIKRWTQTQRQTGG